MSPAKQGRRLEVITVGQEWPGAISDGLSLPCGVCGRSASFDYTVTDAAWLELVPQDLRLGVVCLPCFAWFARVAGRFASDCLESIQFVGAGETIVLLPQQAYRYPGRAPAGAGATLPNTGALR